MNIVGIVLLIIHIICCIGVILVVLLQAGKGASLGASFGGGSSQTVFGAGSASFISRMTWVMAGAFMATSLLLTIISPYGDSGAVPGAAIFQEEPVALPPMEGVPETAMPAPATPAQGHVSETVGGELTPLAPPAIAPSENATETEPQPAEQP